MTTSDLFLSPDQQKAAVLIQAAQMAALRQFVTRVAAEIRQTQPSDQETALNNILAPLLDQILATLREQAPSIALEFEKLARPHQDKAEHDDLVRHLFDLMGLP